MLFVIVAAGEVHPQPHIFMFGKGNKPDFAWYGPLIFAAQPQDWRSSKMLLLVVFFRNSGAHCSVNSGAHCSVNSGAMLPCRNV